MKMEKFKLSGKIGHRKCDLDTIKNIILFIKMKHIKLSDLFITLYSNDSTLIFSSYDEFHNSIKKSNINEFIRFIEQENKK